MDILWQQIINGLTLGSIYALVALGYTLVYGILGLINFAHGEVVMVGALCALALAKALTLWLLPAPLVLLLSTLGAMLICVALGLGIERLAYRPLRHAPRLAPLITAIGVSILLQQLAMMLGGRQYHSVPALFPTWQIEIWGAGVSALQLFIFVLAMLLMGLLLLLVQRTALGCALRAAAENPRVARLMGIDVERMVVLAFAIGSALAAVAGVLVSAHYGIAHYHMGFVLGLKAFTAAVLGGIGHLGGAVLGGLLLGLIEAFGAGYIGDLTGGVLGSHYQDVFAFAVLIAVLLWRPGGLLGERVAEKV